MSNNQKEFNAHIVTLPSIRLAGRRIGTSHAGASRDCPTLWREFAKENIFIESVSSASCNGVAGSYGVSIMTTDPDAFDYMAAVNFSEAQEPPAGMQDLTLDDGAYLKCKCPNISELGSVFNFMYRDWARGRTDYTVDFNKPCFEGYTDEYMKNGSFDVYAPLKTL